jgi:hypothetical protein
MIYVKAVFIMIIGFILVGALIMLTLTGCTISFQNISTHGTATDLVDEEQNASPNVSASMPGMLPVF